MLCSGQLQSVDHKVMGLSLHIVLLLEIKVFIIFFWLALTLSWCTSFWNTDILQMETFGCLTCLRVFLFSSTSCDAKGSVIEPYFAYFGTARIFKMPTASLVISKIGGRGYVGGYIIRPYKHVVI